MTFCAGGSAALAIVKALVGNKGVALPAVISVGGTGCIGAYLVGPTCSLYGTPKPATTGAALGTTSFTVAGPELDPPKACTCFTYTSSVVPVKPVMLNRGE